MPANSSYVFTAGQILTATDLNAVFAQTVAFAADSSNANTGTVPEVRLPYRMDQNVRSNSDVQFRDLTVSGNMVVSGTTTYVNTSVLDIKDKNITLAKGAANSIQANTGGFTIEGAGVTFQYDSTSNNMTLSHLLSIGNSSVNATFGFDSTTLSGGQFVGNVNNYFQVVVTNANTGNNASADFVASADGDPDSNNYINLGINNGLWANGAWTIGEDYDGYLYTSTGNLVIGTADNQDVVLFANGVLANNEVLRVTSGANVVIGNTQNGGSTLSVGNTTVNTTVNSSSFNINTVFTANSTVVNAASYRISTTFIANTTGIYHTGTTNALSYTVGSDFIANTTGAYHTGTVNALSFTTTNITANVTGVYPASNSSGTALGTSTRRFVVNANTVNASGLITSGAGADITGTANVSTTLNVGANVNLSTTQINVGNATVNSVVNSSSITTTSMTVNALVVTSSITIGNSSTNTTSFDIGNSTITDTLITTDNLNVVNVSNTANLYVSTYANIASQAAVNTSGVYVSGLVNSALFAVGSDFRANSSGTYTTGVVNAASHTVGSSLIANSTGVYHTGVVNAASHTTTGVTANATGVYPVSNSSGTELGGTSNRWNVLANTVGAQGLIYANGGINVTGTANVSSTLNVGANVSLSTTGISVGNATVNVVANSSTITVDGLTINSSFFPATANNANNLGGVAAANYVQNSGAYTISGIHTHTANIVMDGAAAKIIANGAFGNVNYVLSSNGTGMYWADLTVSAVNTLAQYVWTNNHTHGNTTQSANVVFANGVIVANGAFGTNNQVLQSNGTAMYWGNGLVVYYANNDQAYP